ncbi:MAG: hydrogenase maturation nickel metallochaperone HypA [Bacteroidetes bacterium]|nr:hydrogenase maturation nickel metallochaperone HypA [Bacteroidota bacterium]
MHELSIVMGIVDIASEEAKRHHAHKIDSIELEIGTMAGVELDALDFAWDVGVKDTLLEHSQRKIETVEAMARCTNCDTVFKVTEPYAPCPMCDNLLLEYLSGKELRVKSLTIS